MKKVFFLLLMACSSVCAIGQSLVVTGSTVSVDISNSLYPVITQRGDPNNPSGSDETKRISLWVEAGNGFFSTVPVSYTVNGNWNHLPLLMNTKLYDTTKDRVATPPTEISSAAKASSNSNSSNIPQLLNGKSVKITPNCFDIVPGDPMAFAITYQIPDTGTVNTKLGGKQDAPYKLYFFYNNNRTFLPISNSVNNTITAGGNQIDACRKHSTETIGFNTAISNGSIIPNASANWVSFSIPKNQLSEKNVFVSLSPYADLEIGKSGSVYAVLTNGNGDFIAADSIPSMRFAPAHDPNYLVQSPYCLLLDKKKYSFNYTVHFQNTGEGNAKEVKVVIQLPKGFDLNSLLIKKANFAGYDYTNVIRLSKDVVKNQVIVIFERDTIAGKRYELFGTALSAQPATDPKTMGEVFFTINSTPDTDDIIEAYADIFFKSVHPSNSVTSDGYEQPVRTNTGVTKYKKQCVCNGKPCPDPVPNPSCKTFLGLCWWWWLLILGVVLFIWFIIWRRRKKKKQAASYK